MITTRSKKGLVAVVAVLAAAAMSLTGCSTSSTPTTQTLTIANSAGLPSFDTTEAADGLLIQYFQPVFDSLLKKTPSGEIEQFLATDWSYNDALTELTLNLRTDVKFTDGAAFNAEAAVANIEHQLATKGALAGNTASIAGVAAQGDSTIVITLNAPDPGLLDTLATGVGMMASPASLTSADVTTNPVGTGPYILDAANTVSGDTYAYVANPDYWNKDLQKFGGITIKTMTDMVPRINALKSGQIQGTPLDISQQAEAKAISDVTVQAKMDDWGGIQLIDRAGAVVPAIGNVKVRQAINYALDKDALIAAFRPDGLGEATTQLFSPDGGAYVPALDEEYAYNVETAKKLMAEAGYASGFEVTVPDLSGNFGADLYAAVIEQLGAIGIKVNLESGLPIPDMIQKIQSGGYAMMIAGGPIGTNWEVANGYFGGGIFNPLKSSTTETQSLFAEITSSSGDAQLKAYQDLNTYVVENAWMAPYFRDSSLYANTSSITVETQFGNIVPYIWNYSPAA